MRYIFSLLGLLSIWHATGMEKSITIENETDWPITARLASQATDLDISEIITIDAHSSVEYPLISHRSSLAWLRGQYFAYAKIRVAIGDSHMSTQTRIPEDCSVIRFYHVGNKICTTNYAFSPLSLKNLILKQLAEQPTSLDAEQLPNELHDALERMRS